MVISDVIGDKLDIIASGPTVNSISPSNLTCEKVLEKYNLTNLLPKEINLDTFNNISEDVFNNVSNIIFSSNAIALNEAELIAKKVRLFWYCKKVKIFFKWSISLICVIRKFIFFFRWAIQHCKFLTKPQAKQEL